MWADLETFFAHHEHTVAALEAFSTLGVVVISVTLAFVSQRANRTRIRALANRSAISHSSLGAGRRGLTLKSTSERRPIDGSAITREKAAAGGLFC